MTDSQDVTRFERLVHKMDAHSKLLRAWELKGGVSAQVTALELLHPDGTTQKVVVRQHGAADLRHNPNIAADEFKLLRILQTAGMAAPAPIYLDESSDLFATPIIVIEFIEGTPEFAPTNVADVVLQLATHLVNIHAVDGANPDLAFLPQQENSIAQKLKERPATPDESLDEGRIRDALERVWPLPQRNPRNPATLLHGDFWPGNALWKDGQLAAIIDWEDASVGDPLADAGNSRLEILWAFGAEAMQQFTEHYKSMTPIDFTSLPWWDLCAALRPASKIGTWGLDAAVETKMRAGHKWFVKQAFENL